jgi:Family of unknown function (DUF6267)
MLKWKKDNDITTGNITYTSTNGQWQIAKTSYHPHMGYAHNIRNKHWWMLSERNPKIGVAPDYWVNFRSYNTKTLAAKMANQFQARQDAETVQERVDREYKRHLYETRTKVSTVLLEYAAGAKNVHLEHFEDLLINDGVVGAQKALKVADGVRKLLAKGKGKPTKVTVKWDGSPAIICGVDPADKKFFIGTKSVFAKTEPKLIKSPADVAKYYSDKPGLAEKLIVAYKFLQKLGIRNVLQGDLMFSKSDLKYTEINGEQVVTFNPNTITYAVPVDSDLADRIRKAEIGIVFHTTYTGGPTLADMSASFGADISALRQVPQVWVDDATYKDYTGVASLTPEENATLVAHINTAVADLKSMNKKLVADIISNAEFQSVMKIFLNSKVRDGQEIGDTKEFLKEFLQFYSDRVLKAAGAVKTDAAKAKHMEKITAQKIFLKQHTETLYKMFDFYKHMISIKLTLVNKLSSIDSIKTFVATPTGYKVTRPEGFVALGHDGGAVKLVDRLEFSKMNFAKDRP